MWSPTAASGDIPSRMAASAAMARSTSVAMSKPAASNLPIHGRRRLSSPPEAHAGTTDKAGRPYIEHPIRVMNEMGTDEERMVAVLHDVLEDTPGTVDELIGRGC